MRALNSQRHRRTCGAVAIVNICRQFGYNVSYNEIIKFRNNSKDSLTILEVEDILTLLGFDVFTTRTTLQDAQWFAMQEGFAVAVGYCWKYKTQAGSHIAALDKNGKALNVNDLCDVNIKRWHDSKELWDSYPFVIIVKEI